MRENADQSNSEYGHFSRSGNRIKPVMRTLKAAYIVSLRNQFDLTD